MAVKTRQQARALASDSDPLETLPSLTKKRAPRKPRSKPTDSFGEHNLLLDLPPGLRNVIYEYCVAEKGPFGMTEQTLLDVKKSRMPGLLTVNRQTREEALPIFYKTNEFRFGRRHAKYLTRWLFRAVRPQHLNLIRAISWTSDSETTYKGPRSIGSRYGGISYDVVKVYSEAAQDSTIHLSSVIMLQELGILGSCKVKMSLYIEPRLHVACALHQSTRKVVARKKLTEADAWNEDGVPGEDDVAGLAYAVAKEWGSSAPRAFQDNSYVAWSALAPEMYCSSCQAVSTSNDVGEDGKGVDSRLPWVSQSESVETKPDQPEKASSIEGDQ